MTRHFVKRMNQRGIKGALVNLAYRYGDQIGDKIRLDRNGIDRLVAELDATRALALKARDKGGITVVEASGEFVTTYRYE